MSFLGDLVKFVRGNTYKKSPNLFQKYETEEKKRRMQERRAEENAYTRQLEQENAYRRQRRFERKTRKAQQQAKAKKPEKVYTIQNFALTKAEQNALNYTEQQVARELGKNYRPNLRGVAVPQSAPYVYTPSPKLEDPRLVTPSPPSSRRPTEEEPETPNSRMRVNIPGYNKPLFINFGNNNNKSKGGRRTRKARRSTRKY